MTHQNYPSPTDTDTGTGHFLPPSYKAGRHFLQIPGPTNVPDRILRAIDRPTIDHRGKEFARLGRECLEGMKQIFKTGVSSLASIDYRHDEWGVDVTIGGSQKGLMLPPGLGFNAVSHQALAASHKARLPRAFWSWEDMQGPNANGYFPFTPATNLLYGLREAISMLLEEGLEQVFQRHLRLGEATRRAVRGWGLELLCLNPAEYSASCTAIVMPDGFDEAQFRALVLEYYNLSLGAGLGKVAGRVFRVGHLGDLNDLMLCGTLCGIEMGLARFGVPHHPCGVSAAMKYLAE